MDQPGPPAKTPYAQSWLAILGKFTVACYKAVGIRWSHREVSRVDPLSQGQIERLAQLLGDCGTGGEITGFLDKCGLTDNSGHSTKWRRLNWVFADIQRRDRCANRILAFVQSFLAPVRFVGKSEDYEDYRGQLNSLLAFSGLEFGDDGQFRRRQAARTVAEAERRLKTIEQKFRGRRMHPEVTKYCRTELMQDNYFHAVFEATKGLAQRIRDKAGVQGDGALLVDRVFGIQQPLLALNKLQTDTEKAEHKGYAALLKGALAPSAIRSRTNQRSFGKVKTTRLTISLWSHCCTGNSTIA